MSLRLYDLDPQYASLADLPLEAEDGGEEPDTFCQAVAAIRDEACGKALSLAKVVKGLEAEVRLLEEHTRLLQTRTQARRDRADYLRKLIRLELEAAGVDKVKDPLVTVWLAITAFGRGGRRGVDSAGVQAGGAAAAAFDGADWPARSGAAPRRRPRYDPRPREAYRRSP